MARAELPRARRRLRAGLAILVAVTACAAAIPASADNGGTAQEQAAQQALNQAQAAQQQAESAAADAANQLNLAKAQLAQAQAELTALQEKIRKLDAKVASDQAEVARLDAQISHDKAELAAVMRSSYEAGGSQGTLAYLVAAGSINDAINEISDVGHVVQLGDQLVEQIGHEEKLARVALAAVTLERRQAQAAEQQAQTQEAIIAADEATDAQLAAHAAWVASQAANAVNNAQEQLVLIQQEEQSAEAALAAARADGTIFSPIPGPIFTEDTDLTLASGENAQTIDAFLTGTGLAGLGASYMKAEHDYGVSARYLVAHSILESAWGDSAIAQDKHNIFGFGADDTNPYGDAMSFPSFDACIQYVANYVKVNYLTPGGQYYHGPTLRGMNVDYATDPYWAEKIASIADTIPPFPSGPSA